MLLASPGWRAALRRTLPGSDKAPALARWRRQQTLPHQLRTRLAGICTEELAAETRGTGDSAADGIAAEQTADGMPQPCSSGGALSLRPGGAEQEVPRTLSQAVATFAAHPSTLLILSALSALLYLRSQQPVQPLVDATVAAAVAAGWCLQEWVVHALLLHSEADWVGRRIHLGHHQRPYFHVSIDDPHIVLAFMVVSASAFHLAFGGSELALTASLAYFCMGLAYEWTHYIAHTRYIPRSAAGKKIRMHHMLHHTRNEAHWLAFIVPQVDALFGTAPDPTTVQMSDLAKASLKSARGSAAS